MPRKKKVKKELNQEKMLGVLKAVYMAGWKHNKSDNINTPFQLSVKQGFEMLLEEVEGL